MSWTRQFQEMRENAIKSYCCQHKKYFQNIYNSKYIESYLHTNFTDKKQSETMQSKCINLVDIVFRQTTKNNWKNRWTELVNISKERNDRNWKANKKRSDPRKGKIKRRLLHPQATRSYGMIIYSIYRFIFFPISRLHQNEHSADLSKLDIQRLHSGAKLHKIFDQNSLKPGSLRAKPYRIWTSQNVNRSLNTSYKIPHIFWHARRGNEKWLKKHYGSVEFKITKLISTSFRLFREELDAL